MKNLHESLSQLSSMVLEGTTTKFDQSTSSFDDLLKINPKLRASKDSENIREFLNDIIEIAEYNPDEMFIYSNGGDYFKIPYAFNEAIIQCMNNSNKNYAKLFKISYFGKKVKISFINGGLIFETGSGSIGRVSTAQQETATCVVWNAYIDAMRDAKTFDINDKGFIKSLIADLAANFDTEWITTFSKQVITITNYLQSIGCNAIDYKMCRYGEKEAEDSVGKAYELFISNYTKEIGGKKDNFDPSDVLIYNEKQKTYIISKLKSYASDPVNKKEDYIKELFKEKLIQGISLKKIVGNKQGRYDMYNIGEGNKIESVTKYKIDSHSGDKQIIVLCEGKFTFDGVTDGDGNEIADSPMVRLIMRSFGAGQTAVECLIKEIKGKQSPSLGKCPARYWRDVIESPKNSTLEENITAFNKFLNSGDEMKIRAGLRDIIKGSIKEGPNCFPFILLH